LKQLDRRPTAGQAGSRKTRRHRRPAVAYLREIIDDAGV
jgi:hypothetical protein